MKKMLLTKSQVALVDDSDYNWLSQWKWGAKKMAEGHGYYAVRRIRLDNGKRRLVYMHKAILGIDGTDIKGDHKNGNKLDNQRHNLREATHTENMRNTRIRKDNQSGFKGVSWNKNRNKFIARIVVDDKLKGLGYFKDSLQAAKMYDFWARDLHGEFATTNFPGEVIDTGNKLRGGKLVVEKRCMYCGSSFEDCRCKYSGIAPSSTGRIRKIDTTAIDQAQTLSRKCINSVVQGSQAECVERFESSPMMARAFKENRIDSMSAVMGAMYGVGPIENYLTQIENNIRVEQLYSKLGVLIFNKNRTRYSCVDFTDPVDYMTTEESVRMCQRCPKTDICGIVKEIKNILEISIDNTK